MNKLILKGCSAICICLLCITIIGTLNVSAEEKWEEPLSEMRGTWVATAWNIDIKRQGGTDASAIESYKAEFRQILANIVAQNMNAMFFQVHPMNDAFYPSKYNPWSEYMCGYGVDAGWDPLAWMIDECHKVGVEFHAWLNPYRVASFGSSTGINFGTSSQAEMDEFKWSYAQTKKSSLPKEYDNPLLKYENKEEYLKNCILGAEGDDIFIYLNPASPATIRHLRNTISELVTNYNLDGVHMDDYFYCSDMEPSLEKADYNAYLAGGGTLSNEDFCRSNTYKMVQNLQEVVDSYNKTRGDARYVSFGISPQGSYENNYRFLMADVKKWIEDELIEYVLPQVYGNMAGTYPTQVKFWAETVAPTDVKLYLGLSLSSNLGSTYEVRDQIKYVHDRPELYKNVDGYVFWSYKSWALQQQSGAFKLVKQYYKKPATTPVHETVANSNANSLVNMTCRAITGAYEVSFNEIPEARGYALYAFVNGEEMVFDKGHLKTLFVQTTGSLKRTYQLATTDNVIFVLKTIDLNNNVSTEYTTFDSKNADVNRAPNPVEVVFNNGEANALYESAINIRFALPSDPDGDDVTYQVLVSITGRDGNYRYAPDSVQMVPGEYNATFIGFMEAEEVCVRVTISDGMNETVCYSNPVKVAKKVEPINTAPTIGDAVFNEGTSKAETNKDITIFVPYGVDAEGDELTYDIKLSIEGKDGSYDFVPENITYGENGISATFKTTAEFSDVCVRVNVNDGLLTTTTYSNVISIEKPAEKTCDEDPTQEKCQKAEEPKKGCKKKNSAILIFSLITSISVLGIALKKEQ